MNSSKHLDPVSTEYSKYVKELSGKITAKIQKLEKNIKKDSSDLESIKVWTQKKNVLTATLAYLSDEDVDLEKVVDENPRYKDDWDWINRKWYAGSHGDTVALLNAVKKIKPVANKPLVLVTECAPVMPHVNPAALFLFPQDIFTKAMPEAGIAHNDIATVMGTLSNTCSHFHSLFKKPLADRMLLALCQAVIDDKREQVKKLLDARPDLLLMDPPENSVIQSQCTWLRMYAENPLVMAAKRRQIEMIKLLLPYYDKLPQTNAVMDAKAKGLSAWVHYEIVKNNNLNEDEIVIPEKYVEYAKNMLDVFCKETFPKGVPGQNNIPMNVELSEETEEALKSLLNDLLPKHAVKLNDYFDVELLLLAVYKAYHAHFDRFQNWEQRDTFCVRVIGLIQGVQSPETAKIFCQGLEAVVTALEKGEEIKLSENACEHKLKGGAAYFRIGRDSFIGLGFHFLCGVYGCGDETGAAGALTGTTFRCRKIMSSKSSKFLECYAAVSTATPRPFKS